MAGLADYLETTMGSPLFLGGAALASGEGFGGAMQGMKAGNQFREEARKRQQQEQMRTLAQELANDPKSGLSPLMARIAPFNPEILVQEALKQPDRQFRERELQIQEQQAPLTRAQAEAQTKATLAGIGEGERLARIRHGFELDMLRAKSQEEIEQAKRRAVALGITVPGTPSPARPAPAMPAPAEVQGGVPQPQSVAPADPYSRLVNPAISPQADEESRRRRAGQALVLGDTKRAAEIMGRTEEPKEYQTKDAIWAERMGRAEITMRGNIGTPDDPTMDPGNRLNALRPSGLLGNIVNGEQWNNYTNGAREWIAALLRKDTGAAVTKTEWDLYFPTYFPQPGDSKAVQEQKLARRVAEASKLRASSGGFFERMAPGFDAEMSQRMKDQDQARARAKAKPTSAPQSASSQPTTAVPRRISDGTRIFEERDGQWVEVK